jgi:hypothetical protein
MDLAIPFGLTRNNEYLSWFTGRLKFCVTKNKLFYRQFKKSKADYFFNKFSSYSKLMKATVKSNSLEWLKCIDKNLKSHPKHFWKYVSQCRKKDADFRDHSEDQGI